MLREEGCNRSLKEKIGIGGKLGRMEVRGPVESERLNIQKTPKKPI